MNANTSRRNLLKGAAMLTVAPAAVCAGAVPVSPETPIMRLFREWEAIMEASDDVPDEVADALDPERHRIEGAILAEPVTGVTDIAIKVLVNSGEGCFGLADVMTLECASLAGRDFAKMPGCLFEAAS